MKARRDLDWVNIIFLTFIHSVAAIGSVLYIEWHGVSLAAVGLAIFWAFACGFSVTAGYHRLFAHGTYVAHTGVRAFYLFFGAGAMENSALKWSSDHRRHHTYVDEENDPYSIKKGFWWAHIGWILFKDPVAPPGGKVEDLERDPLVRLQHRFYLPIAIVAGFLFPAFLGWVLGDMWGGFILAGFLRMVLLFHATFCVNSLAHTIGAQPYSDANSSRDSAVTALITLGEGYHNFHHTFPFDYRNGVRGYQFDPTKWLIRTLSFTGLTRDLVRTPHDVILKARLRIQERRAEAWFKNHPVAAERLRATREHLERLLDRWAALKVQLAALKKRTEGRSREALASLRREVKEARRLFREAYQQWFRALRQPELLTSPI